MISSAVLPGAALRVLRTAAGRRALHVALLAGGLFLLGLLCGGRAQAADGATGPSKDTVGRILDLPARAQAGLDAGSVPDAVAVSGGRPGAVLPGLRPVSEKAVRAVRDRVARPVGAAVETVTEEVEGAEAVLRTEVPPLRVLPGLSGLSDLTDASGLADRSGLTDSSDPSGAVQGLSDGSGRSSSAVPDPRAEPAPAVADASGGEAAPSDDTTGSRAVEGAGSPVRVVGYGPEADAAAAPAPPARTHPAGTAHTEYPPARPAPTGDPDGALGTASGADQGTPRHGEARAVTPLHRITFRLVPGIAERAHAAGVREAYRAIPVSPA
ncbi:hypothetical protein [Streptomyces sp. NPDC060275]|uniref:hypothetical protein n=1 Tax=Streptomyces sp. NPDC060275 TaxID=3347090 RepID=UPI00365C3798